MEPMVYEAPDGIDYHHPTDELLREVIFESDARYWATKRSAAALRVIHMTAQGWRWKLEAPSLEFFFHEPFGFHFNYFGENEVVPVVGDPSKPWVVHRSGDTTLFVPQACFVSRLVAWEIIEAFRRTCQPAPSVQWVDWWMLDTPISLDRIAVEDLANPPPPS